MSSKLGTAQPQLVRIKNNIKNQESISINYKSRDWLFHCPRSTWKTPCPASEQDTAVRRGWPPSRERWLMCKNKLDCGQYVCYCTTQSRFHKVNPSLSLCNPSFITLSDDKGSCPNSLAGIAQRKSPKGRKITEEWWNMVRCRVRDVAQNNISHLKDLPT